jgi:hypothetical protein
MLTAGPPQIGFYARTNETVLVLFSSGTSDEFLEPDVELVSQLWSAARHCQFTCGS